MSELLIKVRRMPHWLVPAAGLLATTGYLVWAGAGAEARLTSSRGTGHAALHVIPFPGTPDASPESRVIFSALKPSDLAGKPIVTGAGSGVHAGSVRLLPDHAGTAFVPAHPFKPGEKVTVKALLSSAKAGTASGDPGSQSLNFSFTVGVPGAAAATSRTAASSPARRAAAPKGAFRSRPDLDPPPVDVHTDPAPGPDDIFLTPKGSAQAGPMILNRRGQLLWFRPVHHGYAYNLEVKNYLGQRVLTWWQGQVPSGYGVGGRDMILNSSYQRVAALRAGWGYSSDLHEFQLTPQGTALLDIYDPVLANLSSVGGPSKATLLDCLIQELDVRTGQVLWEWHTLGHVPLADSYWKPNGLAPYDPYHINSIQQLPGQRLLISLRNTSAVYLIDERTGRIIWTLGGSHSSFKMGQGTNFEWQHDAHLNRHGLLSVFDDAALPQREPQSSAKVLRVDTRTRSVSLVRRYEHSPAVLASAKGSAQLVAGNGMFVGWGTASVFSQYTSAGRQVFNATFPIGVTSYRAYRFAWTGRPRSRPALAVSRSANGTTWLHVSWNGDTQVAAWRVLGGSTRHSLRRVHVSHRAGFETGIRLNSPPRYLSVQALDNRGHALGRSRVVVR